MTRVEYNDLPKRHKRQPPAVSAKTPGSLAVVRDTLRGNQDLLRNASSLAATTGITSFLGVAYWVYAARVFPTEAVGYGSAAIATMTLLGTIGMFGLDTMLIGQLPRGGNRGGLMMASCIASFIASCVLGLGFALVSMAFGSHFVEVNGTFARMAVFTFGAAITGATSVFDGATIGLMRGSLQLSRNITVSIAKMAALPIAALVLHDVFGVGIMLSWVVGIVASLVPVIILIKRGGSRILHKPDWVTFWRLGKVTLAHNWLNLAVNIPPKLIPVLVAAVVSPSSNGAYYIATMISSFLVMVPSSLSTVLFAVAAAAPEKMAEKLRFVLRTSLAIGIPAVLVMGVCAHWILGIFNSSYAALATIPLVLLLVGYLPTVPNTVYIAVARATGRMNRAAVFLTVFTALRMAALVVGGKLDGLIGLSVAMLAIAIVQSLITAPSVLRMALGSVTVPHAVDPLAADEPQQRSADTGDWVHLKQEEGVAALIALAAPETAGHRARHRRSAAAAVTKADPALRTDTNWWPDLDEETFRTRQETGVAALIAIATQAAKL